MKNEIIETIDVTPTWADVLPVLLTAHANGGPEGQKAAYEELRRMARLADKYNESLKSQKESDEL